MKKITAWILLLALLLGCVPSLAATSQKAAINKATPPDMFAVEAYENGVVITKYTGKAKEVVIPDTIYSDTVLGIDTLAFEGNDDVKSITLPHTVTFVGPSAFKGCKNLSIVVLGSATKTVGSGAFVGCRELDKLYVPAGVQRIALDAFSASSKFTIVGERRGTYAERFVRSYPGPAKIRYITQASPLSITISGSEAVLVGKTTALTAHINTTQAKPPVAWKSANPAIATVDEYGVVTGVKAGNATIKAICKDSEATHRITVTSPREFTEASLPELFSTPANNTTPIPRLAILSMDIAFDAYTNGKAAKTLRQLGFTSIVSYNYPEPLMEHGLAHTLGKRTIMVNGEKRTLYAVIDRSTHGSGQEWISNLDMGSGEQHLGFSTAGNAVYDNLIKLMGSDVDKRKAIVWITGHSRGAAVSNYVAKKLWDAGFNQGNLYGYTYACPTVTKKPDPAVTVFNYCSDDDLIVKIPLKAWGFDRNGTTFMLKRSDKAFNDMKAFFKKSTGTDYTSMTGSETDNFVNFLYKYLATQATCVKLINYLKQNANKELGKLIESFWTKDAFTVTKRLLALVKKLVVGQENVPQTDQGWVSWLIDFFKSLIQLIGSINGNMVNAHDQTVYVAWMAAMYAK